MAEITLTPYFIPLSAVGRWPLPEAGKTEHHRTWYVPYAIVLFIFGTACVATRLYASITKRIRPFGTDDILIILGWTFGLAFTVATCWGVLHAGFDRHIWEILYYGDAPGFIAWIVELFFLIGTGLTKISILLFYRRLLQRTNKKRLVHVIDAGIAFTTIFVLTFCIFLFCSCTPWKAAWQAMDLRYMKSYKCVQRRVPDILVGVVSVLTDIYTLLIPELLVYSLRMEKSKKIVLYLVFGSGILVSGAAIARTYYLAQLSYSSLRDLSWIGYDTMIWGQLEFQLTFVYACAPALKAFLTNIRAGVHRLDEKSYRSGGDMNLSPSTSDRSHIITTFVDGPLNNLEIGKGILVTETLSTKSSTISSPVNDKYWIDNSGNHPDQTSHHQVQHTSLSTRRPTTARRLHSDTRIDGSMDGLELYMSRMPERIDSQRWQPIPQSRMASTSDSNSKALRILGE